MPTVPFVVSPAIAPATPAEAVVATAQRSCLEMWRANFTTIQSLWNSVWANPAASPDQVIAALGTGAVSAFTIMGTFVGALAGTAANVSASTGDVAAIAAFGIPKSWSVSFNADGSATPTNLLGNALAALASAEQAAQAAQNTLNASNAQLATDSATLAAAQAQLVADTTTGGIDLTADNAAVSAAQSLVTSDNSAVIVATTAVGVAQQAVVSAQAAVAAVTP